MNPRALNVKYIGGHQLLVTFRNNEQRQFDLNDYLNYPVYHPLKDESFCSQVKVVDGVVQWNEDIDIDPDTLYLDGRPILIPV
jgi:hypothetical protein